MTKKELIISEINKLPEPLFDRLLDFIRYLKMDFSFKDLIIRINDRGVQNLLKHIEPFTVALALKNAPNELIEKFLRNISKKSADNLKENIEFMRAVRVSEVEKAQRSIIDMVRRLEKEGELIIDGGDVIV